MNANDRKYYHSRGVYRVRQRWGKLSLLLYNRFLSLQPFDILESDYTVSGVLAMATKVKRVIVEQAEKTTRRERVLLFLITLIIAGEIYYRAFGGVWCG